MATPNGRRQFFLYGDAETLRDCNVFVIPNGYGVLAYAHDVGASLSRLGHRVCAVNVAGQGESEGLLSIAAAQRDLIWYLNQVAEERVSLVVHCSAMLALLRVPATEPFWRRVDRIVLYAYLAHPDLHLDRFHQKAQRFGVRINPDLECLTGFGPDEYGALPVPLAVIHPRDRLNQIRASDADVEQLILAAHPYQLARPDGAYAIDDQPQSAVVSDIVTRLVHPFLTAAL
ncbi:MAG: hypothetical protein KF768_05485 [Phycisphaeraceae bacterium]|nr:hypothetical protein [Phycisphaeraceae bacterium]